MFEVLVYLFENYFEANVRPDHDTLAEELFAAGFEEEDISRAFDWFGTLEQMSAICNSSQDAMQGSVRIFATEESAKLGSGLGFLAFLEQAGVITPVQRELVIDRIMALPDAEATLEQVKWIMLITLWSQGKVGDYLFVEDALFGETRPTLH